MLIATAALCLTAVAVIVYDWRLFLFAIVPVALLQDPLRKLVPGQPVIYTVLVGVVMAAAVLAATARGVSLMPTNIRGWRQNMGAPFAFFAVIIIVQGLRAWDEFGSAIVPAIGALTYLTPFVALALVYQALVRKPEAFLTSFLKLYIACALVALLTIGVQFSGYDWPILGEVGLGIRIYDQGTIMGAFSGVFRSSEIAAWHAATAACFLIILLVNSRQMTPGRAALMAALILIVIGLGLVTGRRKFLVEIMVFVLAYATLLLYFRRGMGRLAVGSAAVGVLGLIAFVNFMPEEKTRYEPGWDTPYELYVERSKTVFSAIPDRFTGLGLAPVGWAYNQYGFFGAGLGAGSQGVQHFGGGAAAAAEGGLGKIFVELGAIGLIAVAWLGLAMMRYMKRILVFVRRNSMLSRMALGLTSFLIANVATFSVATQAYADLFVLTLLGTALGALLAMPVYMERRLRIWRWSPQAAKSLSPQTA